MPQTALREHLPRRSALEAQPRTGNSNILQYRSENWSTAQSSRIARIGMLGEFKTAAALAARGTPLCLDADFIVVSARNGKGEPDLMVAPTILLYEAPRSSDGLCNRVDTRPARRELASHYGSYCSRFPASLSLKLRWRCAPVKPSISRTHSESGW